jgi:hypothetical protein
VRRNRKETQHGNDERIRVEEVRRGPKILFDVVARVAGEMTAHLSRKRNAD